MRGLLIAGTTSDAGKSVITTGLCRYLARQGVKVAPFKAQNMSNNSMVTADGAEIGRAQWIQAVAAGAEPEAAMNPVLLKPGSDLRSHLVVMGEPAGAIGAADFGTARTGLVNVAYAAFDDLAARYDVVICEGAGSPTEINLREHDFVNLGLARHADVPVLVVGDIDRGGVFAAFHGTVALLSKADQDLVSGFVINKFRGDDRLLAPALEMIRHSTGRRVVGVLPWLPDMWLDSEDTLAAGQHQHRPPLGTQTLRVVVVRFPRISNFTDIDALAAEPGVVVRFTDDAAEVAAADLAILPGTRSTVDDLGWLRDRGIDAALRERAAGQDPILGICGGYQMLAREIVDSVEQRPTERGTSGGQSATRQVEQRPTERGTTGGQSATRQVEQRPTERGTTGEQSGPSADSRSAVAGLGLLPATVRFGHDKVLGRPTADAYRATVRTAYAIHHGRVTPDVHATPFLDGCRDGATWGTTLHGAFESDDFRRAFLADVADRAGRPGFVPAPDTCFAELREQRIDRLADAIADHLDTAGIQTLIDAGPPARKPFIPPGAPQLGRPPGLT